MPTDTFEIEVIALEVDRKPYLRVCTQKGTDQAMTVINIAACAKNRFGVEHLLVTYNRGQIRGYIHYCIYGYICCYNVYYYMYGYNQRNDDVNAKVRNELRR